MLTREEVITALDSLAVPDLKRSLVAMNLVRDVKISEGNVEITLAGTGIIEGAQSRLTDLAKEVAGKLEGVKEIKVSYENVKPKELNNINQVIAVMSGKGGVGKSLVAGLTAMALHRQGCNAGILDADITGPSIPKLFGLEDRPAIGESGILPVLSRSGIAIMSINLLLPNEDDAVIWRGPLIGHAITQFWEDVLWGKLDYLVVDLPPGTADAPLTVMQQLPISGVIFVFTPQDLTAMVVRKAVKMARQMNKTILGVVENMSYLYIPEIDKKMEIFGKSRGEEMAQVVGAPLLGQLPIDPELARLCDQGNLEHYESDGYNDFAQKLNDALAEGSR
jgi:Mrp family chromosome partitioning ATPase